jgi:hypothetical protein
MASPVSIGCPLSPAIEEQRTKTFSKNAFKPSLRGATASFNIQTLSESISGDNREGDSDSADKEEEPAAPSPPSPVTAASFNIQSLSESLSGSTPEKRESLFSDREGGDSSSDSDSDDKEEEEEEEEGTAAPSPSSSVARETKTKEPEKNEELLVLEKLNAEMSERDIKMREFISR